MPLKTRDVKKALSSKGFQEKKERDHFYYFFYYKGKKTSIFTKISHGQGEIGDNICSQMAKQTKLTNGQFRRFVDCRLTEGAYIDTLIRGEVLEPQPESRVP